MDTRYIDGVLIAAGFVNGNINERQKQFLTSIGFPQQINEAWYWALRSIGGTGSLPDMFFQAKIGQININDLVNPYAGSIAAYDFTSPSGYVLNTGRVETLVDLSPNGRNLGQSTSGDRPTVGTMTDGKAAGVYTNAEEWNFTDDAILGALVNDAATADFSVTITFERTGIGTAQTLISWCDPAANVNEMTIGFSAADRIRISRENSTPVTNTVDSPLAYATTGVTNVLTVNFSGGLVSMIMNGTEILTGTAFAAGTPTIAASRMAIGSKAQLTTTQGFEGFINSVVIE